MEEKKIQTTLRFDPAFHEELRIHLAKKRLRSIQQAVEDALRLWMRGDALPPPKAAPPAAHPTEWHRKLTEILSSGDEATIHAVTQNIDVFHDRLRPSRKRKAG
jgi:DNA-binding FadR family transcriptional regulator